MGDGLAKVRMRKVSGEDEGGSSSGAGHGTVPLGVIGWPPHMASVKSTSLLQGRPLPLPVALPSQVECWGG